MGCFINAKQAKALRRAIKDLGKLQRSVHQSAEYKAHDYTADIQDNDGNAQRITYARSISLASQCPKSIYRRAKVAAAGGALRAQQRPWRDKLRAYTIGFLSEDGGNRSAGDVTETTGSKT
jgi:hypothetical protein